MLYSHFRTFLCLTLIFVGAVVALPARISKTELTFEDVIEEAEKLSKKKYRKPKVRVPGQLRDLDYDQYRRINWNPEKTLWASDELNFNLQLFHPGYLFKTPVQLNEFTNTHVQDMPFSHEFYEYHDVIKNPKRISRKAGYAGFKLLYPLHEEGKFDEVISFLGASYFRALGQGQRYGKSARGIAIDTGLDKAEEFPEFVEFWIGKPVPGEREVVCYALLSGPSVAGAYEFKIKPGDDTQVGVRAVLFFRQIPERLGLAPLSSMFWYGEDSKGQFGDFRPEVHDSDGLLIKDQNGEWTWRSLRAKTERTEFLSTSGEISGFGLAQRDRDFGNYSDMEAWYQARPSVWIENIEGSWGAGKVRLIEFPTQNEYFDNIVAYWEPGQMPEVGKAFTFSYNMRWTMSNLVDAELAMVQSVRSGNDGSGETAMVVVAEFSIPTGQSNWKAEDLTVQVADDDVLEITEILLQRNSFENRWRVSFRVTGEEAADIRCRLLQGEQVVSETWSYLWTPDS